MPQQTRRTDVVLNVKSGTELEPGVLLPTGNYNGFSKYTRLEGVSSVSQTPETYHLELTGAQLQAIGAKDKENHIAIEYDVTKYVRSGQIEVL